MNVLYLVLKELIDSPILYLSRYIIQNKSDYYRLLQAVRETGEWEDWIVYIVSAEPDCHSVAELVCHRLAGLDAGICWGRCPRFAENKASNSRRQKSDIYRRKLAFVLVRGVLLQ